MLLSEKLLEQEEEQHNVSYSSSDRAELRKVCATGYHRLELWYNSPIFEWGELDSISVEVCLEEHSLIRNHDCQSRVVHKPQPATGALLQCSAWPLYWQARRRFTSRKQKAKADHWRATV